MDSTPASLLLNLEHFRDTHENRDLLCYFVWVSKEELLGELLSIIALGRNFRFTEGLLLRPRCFSTKFPSASLLLASLALSSLSLSLSLFEKAILGESSQASERASE